MGAYRGKARRRSLVGLALPFCELRFKGTNTKRPHERGAARGGEAAQDASGGDPLPFGRDYEDQVIHRSHLSGTHRTATTAKHAPIWSGTSTHSPGKRQKSKAGMSVQLDAKVMIEA